MSITAPMPEFWILWATVAVSTVVGVYMAARHAPPNGLPVFDAPIIPALTTATDEERAAWLADAVAAFNALPDGDVGTGEDIRMRLIDGGLRFPCHHNSWGALFAKLTASRVLERTGERRMMVRDKGKRETMVYRKVGACDRGPIV